MSQSALENTLLNLTKFGKSLEITVTTAMETCGAARTHSDREVGLSNTERCILHPDLGGGEFRGAPT